MSSRRPTREILLNPGPVNVSARVQAAMASGDRCHREPEVLAALAEVRHELVDLFCPGHEYAAVLLTGSGTAALEAAVASTASGDERLLVLNNGVYGDRISAIARAHGIRIAELHGPPTEAADLAMLERMVERDRSIRWIAAVHHETTTGLLNPVAEISAIARRHRCRMLVDAISGLAGDPLDVAGLHLDYVAGTANKCLQGIPGISFVLARKETVADVADRPPTTYYLHLPTLLTEQERGTHPFTMAVQALFALRAATAELRAETVAGRIGRYRAAARKIRNGVRRLGLVKLLPRPLRSSTLTAVRLPSGCDYRRLHDALKQRGFVIYAGQGTLATEIFRVANMGDITNDELDMFLEALPEALAEVMQP